MRKNTNIDILDIKRQVENMKGMPMCIKVNRGRKRYEKYAGEVRETYPAVFAFATDKDTLTFNYVDVLTGNVIFE